GAWSVATIVSGLAVTFGQLALSRSFLAIGEATYGVIAPTILIDLFSRERRSGLLSAFYLAMPIGAAIGITLGSIIAPRFNWHVAFFIVGAPALAAALLAFVIPEPVRGASEGVALDRLRSHQRAAATRPDSIDLIVNSSY